VVPRENNVYDDKEIEVEDKALTLIAVIGEALTDGTRHCRKSDGALLVSVKDVLKALRDEKVIEMEPKEGMRWRKR
jgi:hypothetical protein